MAITFEQQATYSEPASGVTFVSASLGFTPTVGRSIILSRNASNVGQSILSVNSPFTDWTFAVAEVGTFARLDILIGTPNGLGIPGNTASVVFNTTTTLLGRWNFSEWSGLGGVYAVANATSGSSVTVSSPIITPASLNDVLAYAVARGVAAASSGPNNGFTALSTPSAISQHAWLIASPSSGSYATDWQYASSTNWGSAICAFAGTPNYTNVSTVAFQ